MDPIVIMLLVSLVVFAGALAGLNLPRVMPGHHLTQGTHDTVKLATGMMSVLASLVLGLLIATAKSSHDTTDRQMRAFSADLALLNETLRDYGDTAARPHALLRQFTVETIGAIWPAQGEPDLANPRAGQTLQHVREELRALKPIDDGQKWLAARALDISTDLLRQRWQLIEQTGPSVQTPVLVILVSWVVAIFASFGLNAPRNGTVIAVFAIAALAIGGAIFLIMEMDTPLEGLLHVSSAPMLTALEQMDAWGGGK
jgi:hypothetical protein